MKISIISDEYMEYDLKSHKYILTPQAVLEELGVDLHEVYGSDDKITKELKKRTKEVYHWLYSKAPASKYHIEYLIATGGIYREAVFEALLGQVEYAIESAGSQVALQPGVLLSKGSVVPLEQLRGDVVVSLRTQQALQEAGLLYQGFYSWKPLPFREGY